MLLPVPNSKTIDASTGTSTPLIARFLPSLTDIAFLMPLMFLYIKLAGARSLLGDGDTGWHIRTGEWILAHHAVPQADFFSYSRPGAPWFAWEWLWDVLFALLHQRWGMPAVVLASSLVICVTSALLFRLVRRACDNGLVAIVVTLLATGGCAIHWLARPHLFTLLFFTITLHLVARAAEGRMRLLYWLPPMTLVWTNLHGGFFVIFLVLACYIADPLIKGIIEPNRDARRVLTRSVRPWLAIAALCFAVTFINPYGWRLHVHLVQYISDPYQLLHITEFQSMNFHSPVVVYFEPLMVMVIATCLWAAKRRMFAEILLALGWLHLALIAQRNLPLFAIAAAPLVARGLMAAIEAGRTAPLAAFVARFSRWFIGGSESFEETDRIGRVFLTSALGISLVGALLMAPHPPGDNFKSTYDPKFYPEAALKLLRAPESTRIFTEDEWGDYLIYNLYPQRKVFIDGRSDFYGDEFGERYLDVMNVQTGWQKTLDKYGVDTIVLSPKFALSSTLKISRDWRVVYDDQVALIFRRNTPPTGSLVSSDEGKSRDPAIAESTTRDRKITQQPKT